GRARASAGRATCRARGNALCRRSLDGRSQSWRKSMTPTMDATTRRLVDFALAYRFEDLPASTVHAAKARLLDSVAVGLGAHAAALAAGRVMGLDAEQLGHALSLAVVPHLCTYQTRSGELSMWKGCAGPNGARHGIFAAQLARDGMTGPYNAYEGIFGIWK